MREKRRCLPRVVNLCACRIMPKGPKSASAQGKKSSFYELALHYRHGKSKAPGGKLPLSFGVVRERRFGIKVSSWNTFGLPSQRPSS